MLKKVFIWFLSNLINGPKFCHHNDDILKENRQKFKDLIKNGNNNASSKSKTLNSPNNKDGTTIEFISQKDKISINNFLHQLNTKNDLKLMKIFPQV